MPPHPKRWLRPYSARIRAFGAKFLPHQPRIDGYVSARHLPPQDASTHQILNSDLKEYRSYATDLMPILETRSEVKVKVTRKWNGTIHHSKMHSHTKFGIPTSNNIRYTPDTIILNPRSEVKFKVTVTCKWYRHSTTQRCIHTPNLGFPYK